MSNWPLVTGATSEQIRKVYEDGFPAAPTNPIETDSLFMDGIVKDASYIRHLVKNNLGNGKRALLHRSREKFDPGAFGQESQTTGDCTSHGDRSARDTARCVEIHVKGELESYAGRGATEPTYGFRGHSGAGMDPARAARFVTENGYMIRKNYTMVDLSTYDSTIGAKWGRRGVPQAVKDVCGLHPVGEYVMPDSADDAMALFFNGYPCHSGQNIGFSRTPNSNGIYPLGRKPWNHDMATVGYDDTKEVWPTRVYFVVNSWGEWNTQWDKWVRDTELQKILGPPIAGMITVNADIWEQYFLGTQSIYFYSNITGFPVQRLPDYGTGAFL